jgi:hypothetical protein
MNVASSAIDLPRDDENLVPFPAPEKSEIILIRIRLRG